MAYHRWDARHRQAEQALLAGDISAAAEELARIPVFFRSERLVRYTELCALAQSGTEQALETALEGIGRIAEESDEPLRSAMEAQYDAIERQYQELFYQRALDQLRAERFRPGGGVPAAGAGASHAAASCCATPRRGREPTPTGAARGPKARPEPVGAGPTGYEGPFAEEIAALRAELEEMIPAATAREEAERASSQEAGGTTAGPTVRPPHTFNSGGAGGSYSGDTGAEAATACEDYGSPETSMRMTVPTPTWMRPSTSGKRAGEQGRSGSAAPISKVRRNRGAHPPFLAYSAAIFVWADLIGLLWEEESRNFERPVVKSPFFMYTDHEVRRMRFQPFVFDRRGEQVSVTIEPMTQRDAELTNGEPLWQTSWTSERSVR